MRAILKFELLQKISTYVYEKKGEHMHQVRWLTTHATIRRRILKCGCYQKPTQTIDELEKVLKMQTKSGLETCKTSHPNYDPCYSDTPPPPFTCTWAFGISIDVIHDIVWYIYLRDKLNSWKYPRVWTAMLHAGILHEVCLSLMTSYRSVVNFNSVVCHNAINVFATDYL